MSGPDCELCDAAEISRRFHADDVCWIAECEACQTPMVVWRQHGTDPAAELEEHMMTALEEVAAAEYGSFWIDPNRRSIPDHWHVHARPQGQFYGDMTTKSE